VKTYLATKILDNQLAQLSVVISAECLSQKMLYEKISDGHGSGYKESVRSGGIWPIPEVQVLSIHRRELISELLEESISRGCGRNLVSLIY